MGRLCIDHYRRLKRQCVFSHEELICKMADGKEDLTEAMAVMVHQNLLAMIEEEKSLRKQVNDQVRRRRNANPLNKFLKAVLTFCGDDGRFRNDWTYDCGDCCVCELETEAFILVIVGVFLMTRGSLKPNMKRLSCCRMTKGNATSARRPAFYRPSLASAQDASV